MNDQRVKKARTPTFSEVLTDPRYADYARLILELNKKWQPHDGQIMAGNLIFNESVRRLFIECGRKWGKTDFAIDLCWRLGTIINKGQGYYFAALQKAVREIIWAPRRLQDWGPSSYLARIQEQEMRITFTTGTFVKADGADQFAATKGFNPNFVILDEFADYHERFWQAMSPNFASKDAIVVIISSPPWLLEDEKGDPVLFVRLADLWKNYAEEAARLGRRSKYHYINQPTSVNAKNLPAGFLEQEKKDNEMMKTEWLYEREYEAKRVIGGGNRIIGSFDRKKHLTPHDDVMAEISNTKGQIDWIDIADPSQSAFGVLYIAIHQDSKRVWFLDEILEREDSQTLEQVLWPRMEAKENELLPMDVNPDPDRFLRVCDEAAAWWIVGCANDPKIGKHFQPTQKQTNSVEFGCSLLRAIFAFDKATVSDRCKVFVHQLENWRRKKDGTIPETKKDLIDCARYGLHAANYYLSAEDRKEVVRPHPRDLIREARQSMEDELADSDDMIEADSLDRYIEDSIIPDGDDEWPSH